MPDLSRYKKTLVSLEFLVNFFTEGHNALNHLPTWIWDEGKGGIDFAQFDQVIQDAKEEILEFEERAEALKAMTHETDEDDILIYSALRMDGYRYSDEIKFNPEPIVEAYKQGERYQDATELDLLATFFLLQRLLYKWGWDSLPKTSLEWKAFRQLFLDTCDVEVPERYREKRWEARGLYSIRPRIDLYRSMIEKIHAQTVYGEENTGAG
jgi:hypothetical protein